MNIILRFALLLALALAVMFLMGLNGGVDFLMSGLDGVVGPWKADVDELE